MGVADVRAPALTTSLSLSPAQNVADEESSASVLLQLTELKKRLRKQEEAFGSLQRVCASCRPLPLGRPRHPSPPLVCVQEYDAAMEEAEARGRSLAEQLEAAKARIRPAFAPHCPPSPSCEPLCARRPALRHHRPLRPL